MQDQSDQDYLDAHQTKALNGESSSQSISKEDRGIIDNPFLRADRESTLNVHSTISDQPKPSRTEEESVYQRIFDDEPDSRSISAPMTNAIVMHSPINPMQNQAILPQGLEQIDEEDSTQVQITKVSANEYDKSDNLTKHNEGYVEETDLKAGGAPSDVSQRYNEEEGQREGDSEQYIFKLAQVFLDALVYYCVITDKARGNTNNEALSQDKMKIVLDNPRGHILSALKKEFLKQNQVEDIDKMIKYLPKMLTIVSSVFELDGYDKTSSESFEKKNDHLYRYLRLELYNLKYELVMKQEKDKRIQTEDDQDIMVMCSPDELAKLFRQSSPVIWYDPTTSLEAILGRLKTDLDISFFAAQNEAIQCAKQQKSAYTIITTPEHGEPLIKAVSNQILTPCIYITGKGKKSQMVTDLQSRYSRLHLKGRENIFSNPPDCLRMPRLRRDLPVFAACFTDTDTTKMNKRHCYLQNFMHFNNRKQAKDDFLHLAQRVYPNDENFEQYINEYTEYNQHTVFKWYTMNSFFFKTLNNSLRIATADSILYSRLIIRDLSTAIKERYTQTLSNRRHGDILYRGCYMSDEEWQSLQANQGRDIEMYGFLSTSKKLDTALRFMNKPAGGKPVLITIFVPAAPDLGSRGFADVGKDASYAEDEVLFNIMSRFTVLNAVEADVCKEKSRGHRELQLLYGGQAIRRYVYKQEPKIRARVERTRSDQCVRCDCHIKSNKDGLRTAFLVLYGEEGCICWRCIQKERVPVSICVTLRSTEDCNISMNVVKIEGILLQDDTTKGESFSTALCTQCNKESIRSAMFSCRQSEETRKTWCGDCSDLQSEYLKQGQNIVLSWRPWSVWMKSMSTEENMCLVYQEELLRKAEDLEQGRGYYTAGDYNRAAEYYERWLERISNESGISYARVCAELGSTYSSMGQSSQALELYQKCLDITREVLGDRHADTATSYNNIASTYHRMGQFSQALELHQKCLDIRREVLGDRHPDTATSYGNIAATYDSMGQYSQTLELHQKCLDIIREVLGDRHPATATSYGNIASTYDSMGQHSQALELHQKCLDITREALGDRHPATATSYNNIAWTYDSMGQHSQALELHQKCLDIRREVLGDRHPDTATSYDNIASTYDIMGQSSQALELYQKCLDIRREVLGDRHPATATSYGNIAATYDSMGQHSQALELHRKCLDIQREVLGDRHPATATSYGNIAWTYDSMGQSSQALELHQKCLEIIREALGDRHPATATSYGNIASTYDSMGQHSQTLELHQKCLDITREVLGDRHPATATSYNNIASTYCSMGQHSQALELHQKCLDIIREVLGDRHPDTATSYGNIASTYCSMGQHSQALELHQKCLDIQREVLGDRHPDTAISYNNIASTYHSMRQYSQTIGLYQKCLDLRRVTSSENNPEICLYDTDMTSENIGGHHKTLDVSDDESFSSSQPEIKKQNSSTIRLIAPDKEAALLNNATFGTVLLLLQHP